MIDINFKVKQGERKDGVIVYARHEDTDRLAYILTTPYRGKCLEIQDSEGTVVARVYKIAHLTRKNEFDIKFKDGRTDVLFRPQGLTSSKWKADVDGISWEIGSENEHKVTSGSTEIGLVATAQFYPGAQRVVASEEKDVLMLVCFAGAFYLRDAKPAMTEAQAAGTGTSGLVMVTC